MQRLLTGEGLLLLAILVGVGLLVLGALELLWPTRPRRATAVGEPPAGPAITPGASDPITLAGPPADDRRAVALRVARALLERAFREPDPASEARVTLIRRAIACLERGLEAAPEDVTLRETLALAHESLPTVRSALPLRRLLEDIQATHAGA